MRNLVVASFLALVCVGCNKVGITDPSETLHLNPQSVHMSVGDSVVFTAEGGDGKNYNFYFKDSNYYYFFNMEKTASNKVKLTLVKDASRFYVYSPIYVDSGAGSALSRIFFQ